MSEIGTGGIAVASACAVVLVGGIAMGLRGFNPREPAHAHHGGTRRNHRGSNRTRKA